MYRRSLESSKDASWSIFDIIRASYSWIKHVLKTDQSHFEYKEEDDLVLSFARRLGFLNSNGSVRLEDDSAAAGGIVRNRNGEWIIGYNIFLGSCSMFEAELWGILDGLNTLIDRGLDNVMVQTDSLEVMMAI
ncbi:hypothetical protein PVK06_007134 [Gossypium arboreum]|uniref:RNase H type-1 domain-containing protein n=1 Tax=Gossypium arboreum TaxID=29729 RepID=A0ABR0QGH8_GOSAR|nr:hypothetical protein PVK06_007134 [Gossypium arboreum]